MIQKRICNSEANMLKGVRDAVYDSDKSGIHSFTARSRRRIAKSQTKITEVTTAARRIVTHFNHYGIAQQKL